MMMRMIKNQRMKITIKEVIFLMKINNFTLVKDLEKMMEMIMKIITKAVIVERKNQTEVRKFRG